MIDFLIDYRDIESVAALAFSSLDDESYDKAEFRVLYNIQELDWCGKIALCAIEKASK